MLNLTDAELLMKLKTFEDQFVERKSAADSGDWLKTVVAFANSVPIGYPAILYIGVRDDGTIEGNANLESLQKTLAQKISSAYPAIYYATKVLEEQGKQCLAVIVPGSEARPHFAGPSFVRVGAETKIASAEQFSNLISARQSKVREILKWKGKKISVDRMRPAHHSHVGPVESQYEPVIADCSQFYVTLEYNGKHSIPLSRVEISFDDQVNRLKLEIHPV